MIESGMTSAGRGVGFRHACFNILAGSVLILACNGEAFAAAGNGKSHEGPVQRSIGVATQEPDGAIVLQLRAASDGDAVGDALVRYPPNDVNYSKIARHVGPIPRGGSVQVRPFEGR
jgi:hypothetical protein